MINFSAIQGKICTSITGAEKGSDEIEFLFYDGTKYRLFHSQDCCESVLVEDVCGDINDIAGHRIELAEESTSHDASNDWESCTWTFYRLRTVKGNLDIRWCGTSNGYYSERVDFEEVDWRNE